MRQFPCLLVVVGVIAAALGMASVWADSDTFTAGSLDIATTPTATLLTLNLAAPGDSTGGVALTAQNLGTLDLRYAVKIGRASCRERV